MSEEITRWRKKPVTVEAVQFDGSNRRQVLQFAYPGMSGDGLHGAEAMALPVVVAWAGGDVTLRPGDWVIREHGAIGVMDALAFAAVYEPAPASIAGDLPPLPQRNPGGSLTPGHAARKAWEEHWGTSSRRGRGTPEYDERADEDAGWEAVAQASLAATAGAAPEVRRGTCPLHADGDHVQLRTHGNWMCVQALRGLDEGWPELEAERNAARNGRDIALVEVARLRGLVAAALREPVPEARDDA